MSRDQFDRTLLEATPALGYKRVDPPASRPVENVTAAKEALLSLGRGTNAGFHLQEAIDRIMEESWPMSLLRGEIEKLGVRPQGRTRADLAQQLIALFYKPERLDLVFHSLDSETQAFYAQMLLNLELGPWNPDREGWLLLRPISKPVATYLRQIVDVGLAFELEPDEFSLPPGLNRNLPRLYVPADAAMIPYPPRQVELARPAYTVVQIQQFLGLVGARKFTLRPTRKWVSPEAWQRSLIFDVVPTPDSARALVKMRQHETMVLEVLPPEPELASEDLDFLSQNLGLSKALVETLYHLLLGLRILRSGSPVQAEPALLEAFMTLEPGEQLTALTRQLAAPDVWSPCRQLWREGRVRMQSQYRPYWGRGTFSQAAAQTFARLNYLVLRYLAFLPHDLWLSPEVTADLLSQFLPKGEMLSPYRMLQLMDTRGSWPGFLRTYLEAFLTGPLHWLGLCDVGRDARGIFTAFRLHQLQDVVWWREKALSLPSAVWREQEVEHWIWKQGQLLLHPPVPTEIMQLLPQWADPLGIDKDWLIYRPSVQRLYTAFEAGETAVTLRERWLQGAGAPPPPELFQWWDTWQQRYGHVRLYPHQAILIAADTMTMKEVQVASPELRDGLLGLINPRTALLRVGEVDRLLKQLTARGYMPKELRAAEHDQPGLPEGSKVG